MIKILHIGDDKKFQDYIRETFKIDEVENKLISSKDLSQYNTASIQEFDHIIIHYLSKDKATWLLSVKPKNVIWFIWGNDIQNLAKFSSDIYLPKTAKLLESFSPLWKRMKYFKILSLKNFPKIYDYFYNQDKIMALNKINVAVPVLPLDYKLLQENYHIRFPSFHLNYLIPELTQLKTYEVLGNNILIGNSANPSNNHMEAIEIIEKAELENTRKIYVPLNYGNTKYRKVLAVEIQKFELNTVLLTEMVPLPEYLQILTTCNVMVLNNLRQQAMGTIIHGLILGCHIYLNANSPQYHFLKDNDLKISALNAESKFIGLSQKDRLWNREVINRIYGEDLNKEKIRQLLNIAN